MQPSNEELIAALRHLHPYTIERPALFEFVEKLLARADEPQAEPGKWVLREVMFDDDGQPLSHREPQTGQPGETK